MKSFIFILTLFFSNFLFSQQTEKAVAVNLPPIHNAFSFMENKGQWDEDILFKSSFKGGNFWIQRNKFLFHLQDFQSLRKNHINLGNPDLKAEDRQHVVHLNFKNSNTIQEIRTSNPSTEYYNFFLGNDQKHWAKNVHTYSDAHLVNIYNGINIHLIQEDEQLKYEFIVSPHSNPNDIQLEINGATTIFIDRDGKLHLSTPLGDIIENKPYVYQEIKGVKKEIKSEFQLVNGIVSFKLGKYDENKTLIIDPVLVFATYSGSPSDNFGMTATYGHDGTAYSGGTVFGNSYPTPDNGVFNIKTNFTVVSGGSPSDVFISKYSTDGSQMLWTAFLGGTTNNLGAETIHSLICDEQNNIYAFGATSSHDFPTTNGCFQNKHGGGSTFNAVFNGALFGNSGVDIYTVKISSNGHNLLGATYIGGSGNDGVNGNLTGIAKNYNGVIYYDSLTSNYGDQFRGEIMLDKANNILIASSTRSTNFPIKNAAQPSINGQQDGVLFKLKNDFSQLVFSTYIGGKDNDALYSVKIDSSDNLFFCGGTSSTNLATSSTAYQKNYGGGKCDGFIGKLSPDGKSINHLTYVGLSKFDQTFLLEISNDSKIFVVGHSIGGNFPIVNANYSNPSSTQFIAQFDSTLSILEHATTYGNGNPNVTNISPAAFLVDNCGNIYVSGWGANILQGTPLNGMPVTNGSTPPNGFDFHLFVLDKAFSKIVFGSYIGGNQAQEHVDGGTSRFDKKGIIYQSVCGGCGKHSDFPVTQNAWSKLNKSDNCNNLVFKYDFELVPSAKFTSTTDSSCLPATITYTNTSNNVDAYIWDFGNGQLDSTHLTINKTYATKGNYNVKLLVKNQICNLTDTSSFNATILDTIRFQAISDQEICDPTLLKLTANSFGTGNKFSWSNSKNLIPLLASSSDSILNHHFDSTQTIYYSISNGACSKIDSVTISVISPTLKIDGPSSVCIKNADSLFTSIKSKKQLFTFDWSPKQNIIKKPSVNSAVFLLDTSQTIYVQATGDKGCVAEDSIKITVKSLNLLKTLASASKIKIPKGENVQLFGKPDGYHYSWSPENKVVQSDLQNTEATLWENTIFTLKVTDEQCTVSDTILIKVIPWECDFPYVFVPNAFSPNGDNENDILYVRGHPIKKIEFRVYNRWGEKVFESFDINQGWDGTYKGKLVDPDVFDYYLNVECIGEEHKQLQGNITVLR
jgi:gliding motility-associated-like protein